MLYIFLKAIIYIPKQSISATGYKCLYVHELGHALGWLEGHCEYKWDSGGNLIKCVMYPDADLNNYDLQWYDRRHIYY
jgi:hypothetical protein